tara:strand:+ start:167 stop:415 length:249 start_codon:yes stop_codon:yes gene_type:complete
MIDTDKYEGHTPPHWVWIDWIGLPATLNDVDKELMQDAPLLLAEVKRLREELEWYQQYDICHPDGKYCCDECLERNGFEVKE